MRLDINTDEIVIHANRLEKMSRKALPNAVRGTLNSLAFDVKGTKGKEGTLVIQAKKDFVNRNKTFFKATSRVDKAKGRDINTMRSLIGFESNKENRDEAVNNLEAQMRGGTIKNRQFVAADDSRISGSQTRNVREKFRLQKKELGKIRNVVDAPGKTYGEKFVVTAATSKKDQVIETKQGLIALKSKERGGGGKWKFEFRYIYHKRESESYQVKKASHTMQKAMTTSMKDVNKLFKENADRQFKKLR